MLTRGHNSPPTIRRSSSCHQRETTTDLSMRQGGCLPTPQCAYSVQREEDNSWLFSLLRREHPCFRFFFYLRLRRQHARGMAVAEAGSRRRTATHVRHPLEKFIFSRRCFSCGARERRMARRMLQVLSNVCETMRGCMSFTIFMTSFIAG